MLVNGMIPLDPSRKPRIKSHIESLNDALGGLLDCLRTNATHLDVLLRVVWRLGRMVEDVVVVRSRRGLDVLTRLQAEILTT